MNIQSRFEIMFSKFGNKSETILAVQSFMDKWESGYKVVLFGAGNQGQVMLRTLATLKIKVTFFCDNNPLLWGRKINGIKCISASELQNIDKIIVLITSSYSDEINPQLKHLGIKDVYEFGEYTVRLTDQEISNVIKNKNNFLEVFDSLDSEFSKQVYISGIAQWFNGILQFPREYVSENQYFDNSVYELRCNEVLVDAGAYNGDTIDAFRKATNNQYEKIYAFELNSFNFNNLIENIRVKSNSEKIVCFNKGVGNANTQIYYSNDDTASKIGSKKAASLIGEICKLDDTVGYASIIKMDIEGAELDALKGAEHLIRKHKPKLAICIYHKPSDYFEIPLYLKALVPEYKFAVRHYTSVETETVLYAV